MAMLLRGAALARQALALRESAVHHRPLAVLRQAAALLSGAAKLERSLGRLLHGDVRATLERMQARDPGLAERLEHARGYAVFPSIGQASAVLGGAYGLGEVYEHGRLSGYAVTVRVTLGLQFGGDTFSELVVFDDAEALSRLRRGTLSLAANASMVLVKLGAAASKSRMHGAAVLVRPEGGLMLEADLGAKAYFAGPAVLTRGRTLKRR